MEVELSQPRKGSFLNIEQRIPCIMQRLGNKRIICYVEIKQVFFKN